MLISDSDFQKLSRMKQHQPGKDNQDFKINLVDDDFGIMKDTHHNYIIEGVDGEGRYAKYAITNGKIEILNSLTARITVIDSIRKIE